MTVLRTFCILAVVVCAATCAGTSMEPPDPDAEPREPFILPFQLDLTYRWLTNTRDHNLHRGTALFQIGFGQLTGDVNHDSEKHSLVFDVTAEAGYGFERNPTRFRVLIGYSIGADSTLTSYNFFGNISRRPEPFPMSRATLIAYGLGFAAGYQHEWLAPGGGRAGEQTDSIRVQHWAFVSPAVVELRVEGALSIDLRSWNVVPEIGAVLKLGRPVVPVAVHLGWTWIGDDDNGEHLLTTGITLAF